MSNEEEEAIVATFPSGITYACTYGSGAFKQLGHASKSDNMLDFIFVVKDTKTWHQQNLKYNPGHYSFLRYFGEDVISSLNDDYGAKVYFNTLVTVNDRLVKYAIISEDNAVKDLVHWDRFYVAGRLQKPVNSLFGLDGILLSSFHRNLSSAVATALLTLPERFPEEQLYLAIAGLSYNGDFRMIIGEDKNKVKNIVGPNIDSFRELYNDSIESVSSLTTNGHLFHQDKSSVATKHLVDNLPRNLKQSIRKVIQKTNRDVDCDDDLDRMIVTHDDVPRLVSTSLASIIWRTSWSQSIKGIATAGVSKTALYAGAKVAKMMRGFMRK